MINPLSTAFLASAQANSRMTQTLSVLGTGSWGTALATHLARNGHRTTLWGRDPDQIAELQKTRINRRYLPGVELPAALEFSDQLASAVAGRHAVIIAAPCRVFRSLLEQLTGSLADEAVVVWACKGIAEQKLLDKICTEVLGQRELAVISGPSFAGELVRGLPTATTVAGSSLDTATEVSRWFHGNTFRAYASTDMTGVQIAGALKNVYAIAAGISDGLGYGANARSALITRGLAELMRLGQVMGAQNDTLMGLSGVGDLVLTCTDDQSRNRRFGLAIGQGGNTADATEQIGQVVEGINTSREAQELANTHQVDMPIAQAVYNVVHGDTSPDQAVLDLLARAQRSESVSAP